MNLYDLTGFDMDVSWLDPIQYVTKNHRSTVTPSTFRERFNHNEWIMEFPASSLTLGFEKRWRYYNPAAPFMWLTITFPLLQRIKNVSIDRGWDVLEEIHNGTLKANGWENLITEFQMFFATTSYYPIYVATSNPYWFYQKGDVE